MATLPDAPETPEPPGEDALGATPRASGAPTASGAGRLIALRVGAAAALVVAGLLGVLVLMPEPSARPSAARAEPLHARAQAALDAASDAVPAP